MVVYLHYVYWGLISGVWCRKGIGYVCGVEFVGYVVNGGSFQSLVWYMCLSCMREDVGRDVL